MMSEHPVRRSNGRPGHAREAAMQVLHTGDSPVQYGSAGQPKLPALCLLCVLGRQADVHE